MAGAWRKNEEKVKRRLYELREQAYSSGFDSKERALIWEELLLGHDDDFDLDDVSGISDEDLLDDGPLAHLRHKEQPSKQGKKQASGEGETLKSVGEDSAGEDSAGELEQLEVGKVLARQTRERIKEINVIEADVRRSCFSWDTHKRLSEKDRSSQRRTLLHMLARVLSGPKDVAGLHGNREATASDVGGNDSALNSGKMEVISLSELRKRRGSDDADETDLAQGARLSTASTGTASASGAVRASSSSGPAGAPITATTVADAWHGIKNQAEHEPKYKYFQGFHDICLLFLEACKTTHELHEKNPLFRKSAIEKRMSSRRSTTTSSSGRSGQLGTRTIML
ncbi:unnamed protein product [Amoebophrya sp. A25]|nr:unnamed protein product [Amoebophrya sp. A25]|eukprot:GSA25T00009523001.1